MTGTPEPVQTPTPGPARGRGWRAAFGTTLALVMGLGTFPSFAVGALGPFIIDDLALRRAQLGIVTTVLFAVGGLFSVILGPLVDRMGGRRMLVATFVVSAMTLLGMAAVPGYRGLIAGAVLGGVAVAATNPVTNHLVSVNIPRGSQGVLMGVKQSGVQVGAFLAGGLLPLAALAFGWRGAMALSALVPLAAIALAWRVVPRDGGVHLAGPAQSGPPPDTRRFVLWLAGYALLMGSGVAAVTTYLPLYGVEALSLSRTQAGFLAAVIGLVGVGARIAWGRVSERRDAVRGPLLAVATLSVVAVALFWTASLAGALLAWVGALVFGATAASWNAIGMLAIVREVDRSSTGRASGTVLLGFYLGYVICPVTFGWSVDRTGGYGLGWAGLAVLFALAALVAHRRPTGAGRTSQA